MDEQSMEEGKTYKEINEAVARKLGWIEVEYPFGKRWAKDSTVQCADLMEEHPLDYASSIEAVWGIVESQNWNHFKMVKDHDSAQWFVEFTSSIKPNPFSCSHADTAPLAICQAFLKLP